MTASMATVAAAAGGPAHAANSARNAGATGGRAARWRHARTQLWRLLSRHVAAGARVGIVGAGNAHDLPLRRLRRRAANIDLIDLDPRALRRAQRRPSGRGPTIRTIARDVAFGRADAIARSVIEDDAPPETSAMPAATETYDVVVGDLLYSQLLYPALRDAALPGASIDAALRRHGQALTDAVVAWLHASTPHGLVIHLHDVLGWWPGHPQPFRLDDVLTLAEREPEAALDLIADGDGPIGCDPRRGCQAVGAEIVDTAFWRWPFARHVDYLVCASVARTRDISAVADMVPSCPALRHRRAS